MLESTWQQPNSILSMYWATNKFVSKQHRREIKLLILSHNVLCSYILSHSVWSYTKTWNLKKKKSFFFYERSTYERECTLADRKSVQVQIICYARNFSSPLLSPSLSLQDNAETVPSTFFSNSLSNKNLQFPFLTIRHFGRNNFINPYRTNVENRVSS